MMMTMMMMTVMQSTRLQSNPILPALSQICMDIIWHGRDRLALWPLVLAAPYQRHLVWKMIVAPSPVQQNQVCTSGRAQGLKEGVLHHPPTRKKREDLAQQ